MYVYVDASALIALGTVGELDVLHVLDGDLVVLEQVRSEVTTEPARTNLQRFLETVAYSDHPEVIGEIVDTEASEEARTLLGDTDPSGDTALVGGVLACADTEESIGVVSDDRRVRTVVEGLGATVTGTIGVVVRNVEDDGLDADEAKGLVRELDSRGLHMTGELRETAYDLIDDAA